MLKLLSRHRASHPVGVVIALVAMIALLALPFVKIAPNRILSGAPQSWLSGLDGGFWVLPALGAALFASLLWPRSRAALWIAAGLCGALCAGLLLQAGTMAQLAVDTDQPFARTSFGSGFWVASLACALIMADALLRSGLPVVWRMMGLLVLGVLPCLAVLASGHADQLSIMKEWANRQDVLLQEGARHLQIVALAMAPTVLVGVPLGWWTQRSPRLSAWVYPTLNVIQTIPSIALFGLLMAPLAWLAAQWPELGRAGVSGVGLAPAVIALFLYALLPVVRGTLAGLQQVSAPVLQAARGMGFTRTQRLWRVELPLALPVILTGVRTATVQAVGLAAVTALIGAGGLGSILFEGLFSGAQDLVLLGVIPIVLLAVLVDQAMRALVAWSRRVPA